MINKSAYLVLLAAGLSYFFLFVIGNLGYLKTSTNFGDLPLAKLVLFETLIFISMTTSNFYILSNFLPKRNHSVKSLLFIFIFDLLICYHFLSIAVYIQLGDVLRDNLGINWYYMDYSGWALTACVYMLSLVGSLLVLQTKIIQNIMSKYRR